MNYKMSFELLVAICMLPLYANAECSKRICSMHCTNGFARDSNGCFICECNIGTVPTYPVIDTCLTCDNTSMVCDTFSCHCLDNVGSPIKNSRTYMQPVQCPYIYSKSMSINITFESFHRFDVLVVDTIIENHMQKWLGLPFIKKTTTLMYDPNADTKIISNFDVIGDNMTNLFRVDSYLKNCKNKCALPYDTYINLYIVDVETRHDMQPYVFTNTDKCNTVIFNFGLLILGYIIFICAIICITCYNILQIMKLRKFSIK